MQGAAIFQYMNYSPDVKTTYDEALRILYVRCFEQQTLKSIRPHVAELILVTYHGQTVLLQHTWGFFSCNLGLI